VASAARSFSQTDSVTARLLSRQHRLCAPRRNPQSGSSAGAARVTSGARSRQRGPRRRQQSTLPALLADPDGIFIRIAEVPAGGAADIQMPDSDPEPDGLWLKPPSVRHP
jgi:hypothetical protein